MKPTFRRQLPRCHQLALCHLVAAGINASSAFAQPSPEPAVAPHAESPFSTEAHAPSTAMGSGPGDAIDPAEPADLYPFPRGETHTTNDRSLDADASRFRLGKGLALVSKDGEFSLVPRFRAQFLYTWDKAEGANGELQDATQSFMIRRARLQFAGNFWGKDTKFKMELAVSPSDLGTRDTSSSRAPSTSPLLDCYLDFTQVRDLSVRMGQYKVPFNRQRVISSGDLQFVDRSIVNSAFNLDRDLGFDVRSKDFLGLDLLKYYLGAYVGEGRNTSHPSDFAMMYLARLELLPFGMDDFKDYDESDLERNRTPKLSIGFGYGYLDNAKWDRGILGSLPADGGTTDMSLLNADALLKFRGWSLFAEGILRSGQRNTGDAQDDAGAPIAEAAPLNGYGLMTQLGYLFPTTRFELSVRGGVVRARDKQSALGDEDELGAAASYYFARHAFKLQADFFRFREGPPQSSDDNKAADHRARVQLQAAF